LKCLKFDLTQPIYYRYHYLAGGGYVSNGMTAHRPRRHRLRSLRAGRPRRQRGRGGAISTFARVGSVNTPDQLIVATRSSSTRVRLTPVSERIGPAVHVAIAADLGGYDITAQCNCGGA